MQTQASNTPEPLESVNPHSGETIEVYAQHTEAQLSAILDEVQAAQRRWCQQPALERAAVFTRLAERLRDQCEPCAALMTAEMGKPVAEAEAEIEKCAWLCDYYAEHAAGFLAPSVVFRNGKTAEVHFRPLGVVLAIMPWNFPYWQLFRFAVPAIAAGNGVVLKHASNVSGCALALERLFDDCLPAPLLRTALCASSRIEPLISDGRIRAVTFTGSTDAGRRVAESAGGAIKKTVLELGGSDPYLILEDADINHAAKVCADARLINSGQSCIAAKRFIVAEEVYSVFHEALCKHMLDVPVGDPLDRNNRIGPLARVDLAQRLARQVNDSVAAGATIETGTRWRAEPDDAYYAPVVLGEVQPGSPAGEEELFGPVAAVIRARSEADMIEIANRSAFGLGGAVFTNDLARGKRIATESLEVGSVAVNGQVASDPRLPFGGVKDSGYGRELSSFGLREFVNVKSVVTFDA